MSTFDGNRELLEDFRRGERRALEQIYRAYVATVEGIVRSGFVLPSGACVPGTSQDPADVADLVQETFTKAFSPRARAAFDGLRGFGPYLYAIVRNLLVDRARRRHREHPAGGSVLDRIAEQTMEPAAEEPWLDPATAAIVERFVSALAPELRRVHDTRFVEGLSQRDAAAALGIGRQRLRTLERRLCEGLLRKLDEEPCARRAAVLRPRLRA
jgi:RNA polymerase sigma-70 factor (ECF subfamily)